jgi:hypothetical protein
LLRGGGVGVGTYEVPRRGTWYRGAALSGWYKRKRLVSGGSQGRNESRIQRASPEVVALVWWRARQGERGEVSLTHLRTVLSFRRRPSAAIGHDEVEWMSGTSSTAAALVQGCFRRISLEHRNQRVNCHHRDDAPNTPQRCPIPYVGIAIIGIGLWLGTVRRPEREARGCGGSCRDIDVRD